MCFEVCLSSFISAKKSDISVAEVFQQDGLHISFNRQLVGIYLLEWKQLLAQFPNFSLL